MSRYSQFGELLSKESVMNEEEKDGQIVCIKSLISKSLGRQSILTNFEENDPSRPTGHLWAQAPIYQAILPFFIEKKRLHSYQNESRVKSAHFIEQLILNFNDHLLYRDEQPLSLMSLSQLNIKRSKSHKIPGYEPRYDKEDLNPNKLRGFPKSDIRSASFKIKLVKKELSFESQEIKKAREDLRKLEIRVEETVKQVKSYHKLFIQAAAQSSPEMVLYLGALNNARDEQMQLRKISLRMQDNLRKLLEERKW